MLNDDDATPREQMIAKIEFSRRRNLTIILLVILSGGTSFAEEPTFGSVVEKGIVSVPDLVEASGLVASRANPNVFWTHNDKGGSAEVFAFGLDGAHLGTYRLPDTGSIDYEDMAMGPGPVKGIDYLYVGDIGDGNKTPERGSIQVYRFPEPAVYRELSANPVTADLAGVAKLDLQYPDGAKNAEAMMIDPLTGDLYIVPRVKAPDKAGIYRATRQQLLSEETIVMARTGWVDFDVASGGAISPTGLEIALRQETFARIWKRAAAQTITEALAGDPISLPIVGKPVEKNGEAIAFDPEGRGYFSLSDSLTVQPLRYFPRTSAISAPYRVPFEDPEADVNWTYRSNGLALSEEWTKADFDDADWETGTTPVRFAEFQTTTYAFRREFESPSSGTAEILVRLTGRARVYVNGKAVAVIEVSPANSGTWNTLSIDSNVIAKGANVVAIEVTLPEVAIESFEFDVQLVSLRAVPQTTSITALAVADSTITLTVECPDRRVQIQSFHNLIDWTNSETADVDKGRARVELERGTSPATLFFRAVPIRIP
ncbi:MAG: hypothetical protein ACI9R3_000917 [Verrucomicrobiales bacterium]|jgi:hypothetical protein